MGSSNSCGNCGQHIVSCQRPPDPLQLELTHGLDLDRALDFHQHSRADEDLTRFCFIAQPRGDVGYGADGGIVEPALEADSSERGEACLLYTSDAADE